MADIFMKCTMYRIDTDKLDSEQRKMLFDDIGLVEGEPLWLDGTSIDAYEIPSDAVVWESGEFDELALEDELGLWLNGQYPHYLVFANACRWNGASGYKFCDNIVDTVYRDYDVSIDIQKEIKNGFVARESSHDVPMGSQTVVLGLTEDEYEQLVDAEFDEIERFVQKHLD